MKPRRSWILAFYGGALVLYPAAFRATFGSEMQSVFAQAVAASKKRRELAALCWREFSTLPAAILYQYCEHLLEGLRGGMMLAQNEYTSPSSRRAALLGALPFLVFGLSSMLTKTEMHALFPTVDIQSGYFFLGFYLLALVGLLVGWIKGFKRWAYAYLGWAIIFAAWWSNASIEGLKILGYTFSNNELLGWRSWFPMGVVALLAIAWTHSLRPIKQFFLGIWNDWTRLSFTLFTFVAWLALIYDENHHPYLLLFMLGSTLSAAVGAYIYARLGNALLRILCLIIGTLSALGFDWVCDATWDFSAYYHLPLVQEPWYLTVLRWSAGMGFIALFLLGPAILALLRKGIHRMRV